jgi:hypothetical protein
MDRFLEGLWAVPVYYDRFMEFTRRVRGMMDNASDADMAKILDKLKTINEEDLPGAAGVIQDAFQFTKTKATLDSVVHAYYMESGACTEWPE